MQWYKTAIKIWKQKLAATLKSLKCHKLFDVIIAFALTKQMCLSMQFLFPNLVIADLYDCMFKMSMVLELLLIFVSKF